MLSNFFKINTKEIQAFINTYEKCEGRISELRKEEKDKGKELYEKTREITQKEEIPIKLFDATDIEMIFKKQMLERIDEIEIKSETINDDSSFDPTNTNFLENFGDDDDNEDDETKEEVDEEDEKLRDEEKEEEEEDENKEEEEEDDDEDNSLRR
ncbi:uncharacterized protein MONOS_15629 [Monocercomonoides exilis]|uniref:uncharacterized protein n=1 Tax=Monocercomonoides exilis TaxID=2049356 RepID=UPI0035597D6F|nr:hypothetical protein MONOS_15629 [Monocercomonoides exilis]|eukprot:MONOS_15629.1-p1 / transcript=MONOS_15629.1 / gene=MONOS_15629 / organism=Monocercomonoides_exilis_PA203 / gene_product=unspecified product / transcript_product=unspecified product / location=Mono_scaffold01291:8139-8603(-) / protein_length=155 / sequence_SO=supercontig / SO=protein_coding / is_pseudo=false